MFDLQNYFLPKAHLVNCYQHDNPPPSEGIIPIHTFSRNIIHTNDCYTSN